MDAVESFHHALVMQPSSESFHRHGTCLLVEQKPILSRNAVFEIDSSRDIPQSDSGMDFPRTGRFAVLADFFRQPDLERLDPGLTGLQACVTEQACLFIRSIDHLAAPPICRGLGHIDLFIREHLFAVFRVGGHIQDQPVGAGSAVRYSVPRLIGQVHPQDDHEHGRVTYPG